MEINKMRTLKNFVSGTLLGIILGGLLGLLLAPNSGSQTRTVISQKITDTTQQVKQAVSQRREELEEEVSSFSR
jgi:gas vesicle protein